MKYSELEVNYRENMDDNGMVNISVSIKTSFEINMNIKWGSANVIT